MYQCRLTTFDNPFDPFEQFTSWLLYDKEKGYNTSEYLARIVNVSSDMSEKEENEDEQAAGGKRRKPAKKKK